MKTAGHMLQTGARVDANYLLRAVTNHGRLVLPMRRLAEVLLHVLCLFAQRL